MRQYETPTVEKVDDNISDTIERHPSYAQIGAYRTSGRTYLYGSDFDHQHYVTIKIEASTLHRGLSHDMHFGGKQLIEVALSEAQWATFVSAMNVGSGVCCTLQHVQGQAIPQIPSPPNRQEQIKNDTKETLAEAMAHLKDLRTAIRGSGLSVKRQEELIGHLESAVCDLTGNLQFVADQFGEHIEKVTEHAKIEIGAYIQSAIARAGLKAMQAEPPIALPE